MLEISLTMLHDTTLEATLIGLIIEEDEMIEGMIEMEEMKEEEEMLRTIVKKTNVLKRSKKFQV